MRYVTFSGGFHDSGDIRVRVNDKQYAQLEEGFEPLYDILSGYQFKRLSRHFCGIKGCLCGGVLKAKIWL